MAIIKLLNSLIKFCFTFVKLYYDFAIIKINKDVNKSIKNNLSKNSNIFKDQDTIFIYVFLDISLLASLTLLVQIKC